MSACGVFGLRGSAPGHDAAAALAEPLGGDRAADELRGRRHLVVVVHAHVARDERVDVAGEEGDVLDVLRLDELEQLTALARVALPRVEPDVLPARVERLHRHRLAGDQLPRRRRAVEPPLDEVHLLAAEEVARLLELRARRARPACRRTAGRRGTGADRAAPGPRCGRTASPGRSGCGCRGPRTWACSRRTPGTPPAGSTPASGGTSPLPGRAARVVVDHLVVVPDRDHRELGVHPPEVAVGAVERVLGPVVRERVGHADRVGAHAARTGCRRSGRPRRRCSRRGSPRSPRPRSRAGRGRCSSRTCSPGRRRTRTSRPGGSRRAARCGSGPPSCSASWWRSGSSTARAGRARPRAPSPRGRSRPEVGISSRATTRRKPRSFATSSSTLPRASTPATRVQRVMPLGVGSPDITPSLNLPPRSVGALRLRALAPGPAPEARRS